MRYPEIRLFGMKIELSETEKIAPVMSSVDSAGDNGGVIALSGSDRGFEPEENCKEEEEEEERVIRAGGEEEQAAAEEDKEKPEAEKVHPAVEAVGTKPHDGVSTPVTEESADPEVLPDSDDNPKTPASDEEGGTMKSPKAENNQSDTNDDSQQKTLKKPDKILPCPRCNSMDTKFCYYNNYNVNQPRHFCKSCQRYWTAGGTMRNVPVGAGRRKSKNSVSHCRHITISEALHAARMDAPNGIHHPALKTSGTVLSFGPDTPLCESMASILNSAKKAPNGTRNGLSVSCRGGENYEDCSTGSCITTSNSVAEGERNQPQEQPMLKNIHSFPSQIPCLPGVPWPCPWNSAVPMPAICPSGIPMPIFPAPYWNCSIPGAWSIPWMSPPSPSTNQKPPVSGPNSSPTLGKHSRNGELLKATNIDGIEPQDNKNPEISVLVPKTLRIDDPDEAAKSSIWATLGIKNDSITRGGLFKAFDPKANEKNHQAKTSPVLQANPAALSRSLNFQETA